MKPVKQRYQDRSVAQTYDHERFSSVVGRMFDRIEKRALASLLRRVTDEIPDPSVLDIPCGTGRITEFLLQRGLTVVGGDISHEMMAVAKEKCSPFSPRVSWRRLDLERLEVDDNSTDLVTCIRLFHHLESDARGSILRELARVTRRFVLVNVSFSSPWYRMRRRIKRALGQGVSTTSSTRAEILQEVSRAGLQVEARRFVWPLLSEDLVLLLRKT